MSDLILKQRTDYEPELYARSLIVPGMELYGFLGGLFGRDSYGIKKVIEVRAETIIAMEDCVRITSRTIDGNLYTWQSIVQMSNESLEEMETEEELDD